MTEIKSFQSKTQRIFSDLANNEFIWRLHDWSLKLEITLGLISSCHCGVKKKIIPFVAPSSVTARMSNAIIMTYGNSAKKYEHLPELLTPREIIKNTQIHAPSRHNVNRKLGVPKIEKIVSIFKLRKKILNLFRFDANTHRFRRIYRAFDSKPLFWNVEKRNE